MHALKYKPFQTRALFYSCSEDGGLARAPPSWEPASLWSSKWWSEALFWTKGYFEEKRSERNNRKSQIPRCELYLVSRAWAGSAVASSSGEIWRPCSEVWCKLLAGNVTPTVCVHVCVLHCCQNFVLFFQVGSEESLQSWLIEHQSSEGLTLHKLLSQASS